MPAKKSEDTQKTSAVKIRLTAEESQRFAEYCERNDTKRARLGRKIVREIITQEPDLLPEEMTTFKDSVRQLAGISRNLNQLTRAVNAGKLPQRLLEEGFWSDLDQHVKSLRRDLDTIIDHTAQRWTGKNHE